VAPVTGELGAESAWNIVNQADQDALGAAGAALHPELAHWPHHLSVMLGAAGGKPHIGQFGKVPAITGLSDRLIHSLDILIRSPVMCGDLMLHLLR
jgi:hypothetical protein